jgi:hypothetical protein
MTPLLQGVDQAALPGRLNPFYLEGRPLPLAAPIAQQLGLRDRQVVQGTIELRGEMLKLLLNGELLDLPPGLRFRPGEELWLRAHRGAGGWLLKAIDPDAARTPLAAEMAAAPPEAAAESPALSRLLALSLRPPMSPTLLQLFQPGVMDALLKSGGDAGLASLFQSMQLSMRGLTPQALQGAVMSSGFWLEALLGRGLPAGAPDGKSLLRRLIRTLSDKESGSASPLHKALDDIESAQVESLAAQARGELSFAMVLPFRDANPVEIRFFRPPRRPGQQSPPFSVDIHTDNDVLGEIWLKTTIAEAAHVDLMMWAVKDSVVRLARRHSDGLGKRLALAGLTMDSFRVFHSAREERSAPASAAPGAMLDVSA